MRFVTAEWIARNAFEVRAFEVRGWEQHTLGFKRVADGDLVRAVYDLCRSHNATPLIDPRAPMGMSLLGALREMLGPAYGRVTVPGRICP